MYAIVRVGGKQFQAEVGETIVSEKLPYQVGDKIELEEVLLIGDGVNTVIGKPLVEGGLVKAEVVQQFKGKKIIIYKYKAKQRYRRKTGHRQQYTRLLINSIVAPSAKKARSKKADQGAESAAEEN